MKKLFLLLTLVGGLCLPKAGEAQMPPAGNQAPQRATQEMQGQQNIQSDANRQSDRMYGDRSYDHRDHGDNRDGGNWGVGYYPGDRSGYHGGYAYGVGYQGGYGQGYAQGGYGQGYAQGGYGGGYGYHQGGFEGAQSADHIDPNQEYTVGEPQDNGCGECYCLCCKYEPCYYNCWRTECEPVTCKKKCCHYVPRYYEKCCVRYVPQNYTQTCCKYEPEYYYVDECRYVSKRVCDRKCRYVPKYYYKRVCNPNPCCDPCCP